jgi:hypothetical protein
MLIVPYDTELLMWQLPPPGEVTQACGSPFALEWAFRFDVHADIDVSTGDADADSTPQEESHVIRK